ncbi:MAG: sugar-binding domain-containing protein [Erysipelotrichaceae bacterium]
MQSSDKLQLLVSVAKLYYIENMTQNEIANLLGVSRPLISKYLQEAKTLGVVNIEINDLAAGDNSDEISKLISKKYNLKTFYIIPASTNKDLNDQMFDDYVASYIFDNYVDNSLVGLGWGSVIGTAIAKMNADDYKRKLMGKVIPIISNAPISYRNYHTNELVRMLAEKTGLKAEYLYSPVICSNASERDIFMNTEQVKNMFEQYLHLDYAIIQIRNFPSVPDLATEARFEKKLHEQHAIGMLLGYYFDIHGQIITSDHDYSIQIPIDSIKACPNTIAIINARVGVNTAIGALRCGLFDHILISESVVSELMKIDILN